MYQLSNLAPIVQATVLRTDLKDFEKIAFFNMALLVFKDVSIDGELIQQPVVVVDKLQGDPALIMVVKFHNATNDVVVYTFQFEVWPTSQIQRIVAPNWLPNKVTAVPKPKMKLSFLAERNSVAYYERAFEGTFKDTLKQLGQALGR